MTVDGLHFAQPISMTSQHARGHVPLQWVAVEEPPPWVVGQPLHDEVGPRRHGHRVLRRRVLEIEGRPACRGGRGNECSVQVDWVVHPRSDSGRRSGSTPLARSRSGRPWGNTARRGSSDKASSSAEDHRTPRAGPRPGSQRAGERNISGIKEPQAPWTGAGSSPGAALSPVSEDGALLVAVESRRPDPVHAPALCSSKTSCCSARGRRRGWK